MTRQVFAVYGVTWAKRREGGAGRVLAVCNTMPEAEKAVEEIRWRLRSWPTRIVREDADPPYTQHEEWAVR